MSQQSQAADYQAEQRAVSAHLIEEMAPLWELIRLGAFATTVPAWIDAVIELLQRFASMSGTLAADHYSDARDLAKARGLFQPAPVQIPDGKAEASLRWATKDLWIPEADGPSPIEQRLAAAEEKAVGASQKIVADAGRDTIAQAVLDDREALGWGRTTGPQACHFCALLVSRGPVFHSEETAGAEANAQFEGEGKYKFHNHCVPGGTLVDGPAAEVGYRRDFQGEVVVVCTAAGHELTITPNHPVLTDKGWIPAGVLREGQYVLSSLNAQGSLLPVPDEQHGPSRIEDVWGALSVLGLVSVPGSAEDFHGDGTDSEVHVVRTNRFLRHYSKVRSIQIPRELDLSVAGMRHGRLACPCSLDDFLKWDNAPANSFMRLLYLEESLLLGELARAHHSRLAGAPDLDTRLIESTTDHGTGHPQALRQREFALARQVGTAYLRGGNRLSDGASGDAALLQLATEDRLRDAERRANLSGGRTCDVSVDGTFEDLRAGSVRPRRFDPAGFQGLVDGADAYARLGRDLGERLSGRVQRDRVIEVRRVEFAGQVFNLQTAEGWYRANGVIVSNCDCTIYPIFKGQRWEPPAYVDEWDRLYTVSTGAERGTKDKLRAWRRAFEGREG